MTETKEIKFFQAVRLIDVLVIAPILFAAAQTGAASSRYRETLKLIAAGTLLFNLINLYKYRQP